MNRSRFFCLNTSADSDHLLNPMDRWELIYDRNKDAQSITTSFPLIPKRKQRISVFQCHHLLVVTSFGGVSTLPKPQDCLVFFLLRKSNNSLIFFYTSDYESSLKHWWGGLFQHRRLLSPPPGNWIRSSALASTCQSLGQLCWPCDNTWPPTHTETRKHIWGGMWKRVGAKVTHFQPQQRLLGQEDSRLSVRALTEAESSIVASRVIGSVWDVRQPGLWQQPRVGAVTFDPNCKNDLNLHS